MLDTFLCLYAVVRLFTLHGSPLPLQNLADLYKATHRRSLRGDVCMAHHGHASCSKSMGDLLTEFLASKALTQNADMHLQLVVVDGCIHIPTFNLLLPPSLNSIRTQSDLIWEVALFFLRFLDSG